MNRYSLKELASFVSEKFDQDIADAFEKNKISGQLFLKLSEAQIGRMVPAIGGYSLYRVGSKYKLHRYVLS